MRTQSRKVRLHDTQRKRRLTIEVFLDSLRCANCQLEFNAARFSEDEPHECPFCHRPLKAFRWQIGWNRQKWESYFTKVREELGLGWAYSPYLVNVDGQFYLQFIAPISPLVQAVDLRLQPVTADFLG
jgi:hypothetical protein